MFTSNRLLARALALAVSPIFLSFALSSTANAQAMGYAAGTTGGGSRAPVNVSTPEQMRAAIDAYSGSGGLVLNYTGSFNFASITDPCAQWRKDPVVVEIKDKSDITIQGANGSSANFGIFIVGNSQNIIVRNMTIGLLPGGEGADSITVEGRGSGRIPERIWIDHNTIFASLTSCSGAGDASFDGGIDIKRSARRVTVSYNHVYNYQKVALNGHTDSFTDHNSARTTYYRNRFENVQARVPLQRFGLSHIVNNYFGRITTSGINVRMGGVSLIEANYFEDVANPVTSRDSSQIGFWDLRNNFVGSGITWSSPGGNTVNATSWQTTRAFPEALGYSLAVAPAAQVKCLVFATAGAGTNLATTAPQCGSGGSSSSASSSSSSSSSSSGGGGTPAINLTASGTSSAVNLSWTPVNLTLASQEVYRDIDSNPTGRTRIGMLGSTIRSYSDSTAVAGTQYWYWIRNTTNGVATESPAVSGRRTAASSSSSSSSSSSGGNPPPLSGTGDYPSGFSKCADLNGTCSVGSGTGWVAYGRKGSWVLRFVGVGNSIACTTAAFGSDPGGNPNKCSRQN
jgi:pectate lyase